MTAAQIVEGEEDQKIQLLEKKYLNYIIKNGEKSIVGSRVLSEKGGQNVLLFPLFSSRSKKKHTKKM